MKPQRVQAMVTTGTGRTGMIRALAAMMFVAFCGEVAAVELPFSLGPLTCRADHGVAAEIPRCKTSLGSNKPKRSWARWIR